MSIPKTDLVVAVWMVTFNHEAYISKAIESVIDQKTDFKFLLMIGEDCSNDKTREICIAYQKRFPDKIELFLHAENIGNIPNGIFLYEKCIESDAKYIALIEGDDYWTDPFKLQKQVDFLESSLSYSGCFHYTQQLNENEELSVIYGRHGKKLDFCASDTFSKYTLFHTSSFLFRKSALTLPDWPDKILGGDMVVFSIVSAKGKLRCLPEIMSIYRKHSGGFTNSDIATEQNYHSNRINLMHYLDEFHKFKYHNQALKIIHFHENGLKGIYSMSFGDKIKLKIKKILRISN